MVKIVLYGEKNDAQISLKLCRALEMCGGVLYFSEKNITEYSISEPQFLVYETEHLESLQLDNAIVIFKSKQNEKDLKISPLGRVFSIVESDNITALKKLQHASTPVLTCGMSPRDTLSISSISDNSAIVSIQREITPFDGKTMEPCEVKIKFSKPITGYPLLCICAVLIMSGKMKNGYLEI